MLEAIVDGVFIPKSGPEDREPPRSTSVYFRDEVLKRLDKAAGDLRISRSKLIDQCMEAWLNDYDAAEQKKRRGKKQL